MKYHGIFGIVLFLALAPLARGQTLEVLHSFQGLDGATLYAGLVQSSDDSDFSFYGTAYSGGASNKGTVFKMTTNGVLTTLLSFHGSNGANPYGTLVQGMDGQFYGTTQTGGANNYGTVFRITTNGILTTLVSFNLIENGAFPRSQLTLGADGNFYCPMKNSGVFKMTTNGTLTLFTTNVGSELMLANDGSFYGTEYRGDSGCGSVFQLTTNAILTTLFSFTGCINTNGSGPTAGLTQASDGNLYGTTESSGPWQAGSIFKITTNGVLTTLAFFDYYNGAYPHAKLIQASDGHLYGTASLDGYLGPDLPFGNGTVFKITTNGVLTTLAVFNDGALPEAELVEGRDGHLYGTTYSGGTNHLGSIFRIVMPVILNSRASGDELVLSWPTNALGFRLQSSVDLNSPTNWIDFTNAPAVVGAQFTVTNSVSGSSQFYRLKKP